jgi:hypothetical protein
MRLNSGNGCYLLAQNMLSSHLLFKNVRIRLYKNLTLTMVLYECDTWFLTVWEAHKLSMFGNWVLR